LTTDEDLGGFWDMVMIQVEQVFALFKNLENSDEPQTVFNRICFMLYRVLSLNPILLFASFDTDGFA
jgi:hypothetical protein